MKIDVTIKILDESNAVLITQNQTLLEYFNNKYSLFTKNYFFNKKYKLGQWDGKISYFHKNGKTYVNLLEEIVIDLKKNFDCSIKLIDNRKKYKFDNQPIENDYLDNITLADHQLSAINEIIADNGGIILAATGAGKTFITAALSKYYFKKYGFRVLLIVPTVDLIHQSYDEFIKVLPDSDNIGKYSGDTKELNKNITISTWQSLQNNPSFISQFKCIIVDECHGTTGTVLRNLITVHGANAPIKIGVTGTIPPEDVEALAVRVSLGSVKFAIEPDDLIKKKWLSDIKISVLILKENLRAKYKEFLSDLPKDKEVSFKMFNDSLFPDYDSEVKFLETNKNRNSFIVNFCTNVKNLENENTIIIVNHAKYAKKLSEQIEGSIYIDKDTSSEIRRELYSKYETENNMCIIATKKLISTGISINRIHNLIMIDIGASFITIVQSLGRGLRKAADKKYLKAFDITSDLKYSKRHTFQRQKIYKSKNYISTIKEIDY